MNQIQRVGSTADGDSADTPDDGPSGIQIGGAAIENPALTVLCGDGLYELLIENLGDLGSQRGCICYGVFG